MKEHERERFARQLDDLIDENGAGYPEQMIETVWAVVGRLLEDDRQALQNGCEDCRHFDHKTGECANWGAVVPVAERPRGCEDLTPCTRNLRR